MSNNDFQARLQRIGGNPHNSPVTQGTDHTKALRTHKPSYGRVGLGGAIMMLGVQVVKYANQNYEEIRDGSGIAMAAAIGIAGFAVTLIGIIWIFSAVSQRMVADRGAVAKTATRRPSTTARVLFSLLGFTFGGIASFYMFLAAAARFVETETAQRFSNGGLIIAMSLALLSLLFGFVGLFLRGRALGRVPIYFFLGGAITYAAFRILRINVLEWPEFVAVLQ